MGIYKLKYIIFFSIILGQLETVAQKDEIKEIERNREKILRERKNGAFEKALELNFKLLESSRANNYQKGITYSLYEAASLLSTLGQFQQALHFVNLAENSEYFKNNECVKIRARISNERARILIALGYNSFAIDELNSGIRYIKKDGTYNGMLGSMNINKAAAFSALNEKDSVIFSLKKAVEFKPSAFNYALLGRGFLLYKKNADSARYFLDLGKSKIDETFTRYDESIFLRCEALYYQFIGDFESALDRFHKSLEISLKINRNKEVLKNYKNLAKIYKSLGEIEKSNIYYNKYTLLNDSISRRKDEIRDFSAREFINQKDYSQETAKYKWFAISLSLGVFIIGGGLLSRKYVRKKYKKAFREKSKELHKVQSIVQKNELKQESLLTKLENANRELVALAKQNDESFLPEFKKLYPELSSKIEKASSKITKNDFILLGMIWLNFSSKNIARYTFVQHKTIQTKKYRLRKKLNLPNGTDLYQWLLELENQD